MKKLLVFCTLLFSIAGSAVQSSNQMVLSSSATVTCATTGTLLIVKNRRRTYLAIVNAGTQTVYVGPDAAPTTAAGIPIVAGGNVVYEVDAPINAIYCTSGSGNQDIRVQEGA